MSTETASSAPTSLPRPPRGTSTGAPRFTSSRGGRRGGYGASRGGLGGTKNSPPESSDWAAQEDNASTDTSEEVAQLKAKYSIQLKSLKEIFPDWTAEDLVFALQEVDGNIEIATDRIAGGHASQWGQVKKKSLKDKPKTTGRPEGAAAATRGRGRGGSERGAERGSRGRGEGRGSRGRGRGETRGRGRGAASGSTDAFSTAATVASDETPSAWPESTSAEETVVADTDSKHTNGINGTETQDVPPPAQPSAWNTEAKPTVAEIQPTPVNGTAAKRPPPPTSTPSRQSRIVEPNAKFSWASIVKPAAPPPAPKPAPVPQPTQQQVAPQANSRPSTRGQDVTEEPAQTIHDPFAAAEPSKPKVQLPQPALPYVPALPAQPKEQLPPAEPLTSRNLDLLEDQQSPVPEPTPSVTAHRSSPAPKSDGPPGLSARFARNSRDTPVVMPGVAAQSVGGMQLQFGSIDLNQDPDTKPEEPKEESLLPTQELETPQQPTPSQQRASPAVQQPQPAATLPQSQRVPSVPGQSQVPPAYQQPAAFGGLIPGQAQRFSAPAPGLTQSKEFGQFPYDQAYPGQTGSGYGAEYMYGAGGQGQYEMSQRDYYNYYQQHQQQRGPPSSTEAQRPAAQSTTPSNAESATPSQFSSATPASTAPATTQPTPTPSTHSQHQTHPQQFPGMHPYWTNPYYNQMYQQHYGGYPNYYQGHKNVYQGQGYGASQYGGQQGNYDRFSNRDQAAGYDSFGRMNYSGASQGQQQGGQGQVMTQPGSQQGQAPQEEVSQSTESQGPTPSQASQQGQGTGYSGYQGSSTQSRLPYGLGSQSGPSSQPQQGYQHHYPPQQQQQAQSYGYGAYNPGHNSQGATPNQQSQGQSQGQQSGSQQGQRGQQSGWGQQYGGAH